jgi:hypothetical protein
MREMSWRGCVGSDRGAFRVVRRTPAERHARDRIPIRVQPDGTVVRPFPFGAAESRRARTGVVLARADVVVCVARDPAGRWWRRKVEHAKYNWEGLGGVPGERGWEERLDLGEILRAWTSGLTERQREKE